MLRITEIQKALTSLVGWDRGYGANVIVPWLSNSESGLTFQAAHPLVTLENIRQVMPVLRVEDVPAWSEGVTYQVGDARSFEGKIYFNIKPDNDTDNYPTDDDTEWLNPLSWTVYKLTQDAINAVVQTFITQKQLNRETRQIVDNRAFFDGAARLAATIPNTGKFVGFEIVPVRALGVTMRIEKIGIQTEGTPYTAGPTIKICLYHSSQSAPIKTKSVTLLKAQGQFHWFDLGWDLPYIGPRQNAGGAWFIGYKQSNLGIIRALNISRDWSKSPCETCYGYALESWKELTKYMQVSPFCIKAQSAAGEEEICPDPELVSYTNTINYGLNCVVSVGCDLTDFIIAQKHIFANVLQKQVAVNVLRMLAMNPDVRVNRNQANITREGVLYEVDGNPQGRVSGLAYELAQAYKALSLDTEGIDRVCLKCNNHGVSYRTI